MSREPHVPSLSTDIVGQMPTFSKSYTLRTQRFVQHAAALVFILTFVAGAALGPSPRILHHWWDGLGWLLASLVAIAACLRVVRRTHGPDRNAWMFYGLGCLAWLLGMLIMGYASLVSAAGNLFPGIADVGCLALAPLFMVGLAYQCTATPSGALTLKNFSDAGLILAALAIVSLVFFAGAIDDPALSTTYIVAALAYPVLYWGTFIFAALLLLRRTRRPPRSVLLLIFASLGAQAVANTLYAHAMLVQSSLAGQHLDVWWALGFVFAFSASVEQLSAAASDAERNASRACQAADARVMEIGVVTFVLASVVGVTLWRHESLSQTAWSAILLSTLVVTAFLGLREWAGYRLERKLGEDVRVSERELNNILQSMQDTYFRTDFDERIVRISDSIQYLLGYKPGDVVGGKLWQFSKDATRRTQFLQAIASNNGIVEDYQAPLRHRDGSSVWVSINAHIINDAYGVPTGIEGIARNVTDRKRAEAEMVKLSRALEQGADAVMITDVTGIIEYVNPAFEKITGFAGSEVLGRKPSVVKSGRMPDEFYRRLWDMILSGQVFEDVLVNRKRDDSLYYEAKTITPLKNGDGSITHFISTGRDITRQMQAQEELQYIAHHDLLTRLPNRILFLDRVTQAMARARWHQRLVALLFLDLDRFKYINDSLGHAVGDHVLVQAAERLRNCVREGDTVARFGGDEFVVLLDDVATESDVGGLAQKILAAIAPAFSVDRMELHVTASIGVSLYPNDGNDSETLLKNADGAMYRAKELGRNTFKFYSDDMSERAFERLTLENSLRHALDRDEFVLFYQPQVEIHSGRTVAVEALLRWQHPECGLISPADFIPLLEETGLIVPVGAWVARTACEQLRRWNDAGYQTRMAVNISARQFNDASFVHTIEQAIADSGIVGADLELEMTESVFMRTTGDAGDTLTTLKGLGVSLAIDDFGTGYSSLAYLKRFPVDTLKIDRSFIRDIIDDADDAALTSAILAMTHSLRLHVVAEGVETHEQLEFLRAHGCTCVQGFLFSRPLPASELTPKLLRPLLAAQS